MIRSVKGVGKLSHQNTLLTFCLVPCQAPSCVSPLPDKGALPKRCSMKCWFCRTVREVEVTFSWETEGCKEVNSGPLLQNFSESSVLMGLVRLQEKFTMLCRGTCVQGPMLQSTLLKVLGKT